MTSQNPNNLSPTDLPEALGIGPVLRAEADAELPRELRARLEATEGAEARVEFERGLRDAVARVMAGEGAPAGLRERIASAMAADTGEPEAGDEGDAVIATPLGDTRSSSFWRGLSTFGVVAAAFALIGAYLIYAATAVNPAMPTNQRIELAQFVSEQHTNSCEAGEHFERKFRAQTVDEARALCAEHLGAPPPILESLSGRLSGSGIVFVGLGACGVPDGGASVHALLRRADGEHVSLFIQVDGDRVNLKKTKCYIARCDKTKKDAMAVWRRDGFVHYLYARQPEALADARRVLRAPDDEAPL